MHARWENFARFHGIRVPEKALSLRVSMLKRIFECGCRHICGLHQAFHQPDEGQRRRPHPGRGLAEHSCFFLLHDIQGQEGPLFSLFDTPLPHCHCCLFHFTSFAFITCQASIEAIQSSHMGCPGQQTTHCMDGRCTVAHTLCLCTPAENMQECLLRQQRIITIQDTPKLGQEC